MSNHHVTLTLQNMLSWHNTMTDTALQLGMRLRALRQGTGRLRLWAMVMLRTTESCSNEKRFSFSGRKRKCGPARHWRVVAWVCRRSSPSIFFLGFGGGLAGWRLRDDRDTWATGSIGIAFCGDVGENVVLRGDGNADDVGCFRSLRRRWLWHRWRRRRRRNDRRGDDCARGRVSCWPHGGGGHWSGGVRCRWGCWLCSCGWVL